MTDPTTAGESGPGRGGAGRDPDEAEPTATGTLFIMMLFLMALGAMWGLMYLILLDR